MTKRNTTVAALFAGLLASPFALAGDHSGDAADLYAIADYTCKQVMILNGDERDEVIAFMHGYLAGEAKKAEIDLTKLGHATDVFLDKCLDSPTDKALATLRAAIGG